MKTSIVIVDSRSREHPEWVQASINSAKQQISKSEIIVINNQDNKKTIGQCYNEGAKKATGDWVLYLGDDDYISDDYVFVLQHYVKKLSNMNPVGISTNMTVFNETKRGLLNRPPTGMYKREYLIKYPFNEKPLRGIDREYLEELKKRNDKYIVIPHHHGYFYRQHENNTARAVKIGRDKLDLYVIASDPTFIDPYLKRLDMRVGVDNKIDYETAKEAKVIWCEWADENAIKLSDFDCKAYKILRVHAYEVFKPYINYIDFNKFDKVIFVAKHIKDYAEQRIGKIHNAVIIPNGIDVERYNFQSKEKNNKIAYAGYLTRKKGIGELMLIAKELPNYEFHIAGKYQEDDVAEYVKHNKPSNVFVHEWQYKLEDFYKDKTFIINTSIRESQSVATMEGMAAGLKPLVYNWIGAKAIYGKYVWNNLDELKALLTDWQPNKYRVKDKYNFNETFKQIEGIIRRKNESNK